MQPIKRKKVTRVGSGAWSIYLPKKWIDSWTPEQQASREVDLLAVGGGLLVVPVHIDRSYAATVPGPAVLRHLLSAYVRGARNVRLKPQSGVFDNDAVTAARDFLRHLDERLVAAVGADLIGFDLAEQVGATGDIIGPMVAKVREVLELSAQLVDTYGTDPDRALHAARLAVVIHDEDVSRLFYRALRQVAALELPLESVTAFQLLDLVAADLHRISSHAVSIATTVLGDYHLTLADLNYPRAELVRRIGARSALPPVAREIAQGHRKTFESILDLVGRLPSLLADGDADALDKLSIQARKVYGATQERLFSTVVRHWGDATGQEAAAAGFTAYQLSQPVGNILIGLSILALHAVTLTAAETRK